jgi:NADH-quinone oxidoreductase subunit E
MDMTKIDEIIDRHRGQPSSAVQVLLDIQRENHWLPEEALCRVSERLGVPLSRIRHFATFHKSFSLVPKGRHEVRLCTGTSCHVRGAPRILDALKDATGIEPGETDADMRFSLETVTCVGCCAHGPVVIVDEKHHRKMDAAKARETLEACD